MCLPENILNNLSLILKESSFDDVFLLIVIVFSDLCRLITFMDFDH